MGTTIDDVIEDAKALVDHIRYYLDIRHRDGAHAQRLVQMANALMEELLIEKREAAESTVIK